MNVTFELSAKIFKEIIEGATATLDKKHVQVYPKVVLLEILENKVRFITCNSEIILEQEVNTTTNNFNGDFSLNLYFFIQSLEDKIFSLIQIPITKESKGNILFSVSEKACQIIYQAKKYDIFISNEPYPDYKSVIPTKNPYFFTISTENLQKAMNRAVLLYPNLAYKDIVMTRFFIEGKKMYVTTINEDKDGQMEEIFDVEVENPPANKFGFAMYSPYMQLASTLLADCEEIKITYLSPQKVFLTSCDQAELKRKLALFPKQGTNYPEQDGENGVKYKNVLLNVGETKNITISSKTLYDALTIVKDFAKETKVNDFLLKDKFYFKVTEGQIEIIVQILDDNLVKVTFPFENYKDVQEFCGLLNFSAFYKFLKPDSLSVQPISLKFNENSNIFEVVHEDGTALFIGQTCQIFPKFNYPQEKTSLGVVDAAEFARRCKNLRKIVNGYNKKSNSYKEISSKTQLKQYQLNTGAVDLLPKKGDFKLLYGRVKTENYFNGIFCLNLVEKIYKTEMFFSGDDISLPLKSIDSILGNIEELTNAGKLPKEKYEEQILFLEDVLLEKGVPNEQKEEKIVFDAVAIEKKSQLIRSTFVKIENKEEESLTVEELELALKEPFLFRQITVQRLEQLLKERESEILPAPKEEKEEKAPKTTTKTTPDVVFLNKVIEIDEAAFEPFDKGNYKEFSDKVNAFLRQYWRSENDFDTITNTQSGFVIGFDNTGIDELSGARRGETKMKALSQIKRIIEDASLFTVREEKKNNIDFLAIYTFITYIKYKGQTYEYQFVVKHKAQGKFIYAVNLDIRKPLN